jgi:ribosomal protein S18 acetylase RimI-like enzyme
VGESYSIRPANAEDMEQVFNLRQQVLEDPNYPEGVREDPMDDPSYGAIQLVVVTLQGEILGAGRVHFLGSHDEAEISRLCVRPEHRRKGIGTELTDELGRHALLAGATSIELNVATEEAEHLYRQIGYTRVDKIRAGAYRMRKELARPDAEVAYI